MKIAICDDNKKDLEILEKLLIKYKDTISTVSFTIDKFTDAFDLYRKISENSFADIYILDLIMEEKNGIDLGTHLRENGCENAIIYVTSSDDFALEAYGVHAIRYLLKPLNEDLLFEAVKYALSHVKPKGEPVFSIKTKTGPLSVPYSNIEYIESYSRMLHVHMTNGKTIKSIFIRTSFDDEIKGIANDKIFLQVHKSFLINMDYVKKMTHDSVIMESGKTIPVSKTRAADVRKTYLLFVSERYQ